MKRILALLAAVVALAIPAAAGAESNYLAPAPAGTPLHWWHGANPGNAAYAARPSIVDATNGQYAGRIPTFVNQFNALGGSTANLLWRIQVPGASPGSECYSDVSGCFQFGENGKVWVFDWNYGPTGWAGRSNWYYFYYTYSSGGYVPNSTHFVRGAILLNEYPGYVNNRQTVACHEMMHMSGLEHDTDNVSCITEMPWSSSWCSVTGTCQTPNAADVAAVNAAHGHVDLSWTKPGGMQYSSGVYKRGVPYGKQLAAYRAAMKRRGYIEHVVRGTQYIPGVPR